MKVEVDRDDVLHFHIEIIGLDYEIEELGFWIMVFSKNVINYNMLLEYKIGMSSKS